MISIIGITYENELESNIAIEHLKSSAYKWYWVDFNSPTDEEIKHLSETFQFHPLAIEDCVQRLQRPKLDYYEDHTFYVTHMVTVKDKEIYKEELDYFIGEHFVITFHKTPSIEVSEVWKELLSHTNLEVLNPSHVFHQILDKTVDHYFSIIYQIEDDLDKIDDNTYHKSMNLLLSELFETRYMLLNLLHTINPMRDLLYRMLNSHRLSGIMEKREYFSDIYDHLLKLSEMVMANREITADIRDSYLSLNSHQTNNVMKILTIITSVFAPLTFIAGIYGMNFEYMPELTWKYGYFVTLGVMGVIAVWMFIWFVRKGWFK